MVSSEEMSGDILDNNQKSLSHNSHRCQHKINAQETEIATMKTELDWALEENWKLKEMFDQNQLVSMLTKAMSNLGVKEGPRNKSGHSV